MSGHDTVVICTHVSVVVYKFVVVSCFITSELAHCSLLKWLAEAAYGQNFFILGRMSVVSDTVPGISGTCRNLN